MAAFLEKNLPTGDDLAERINKAPTVAKVQAAAEAVADVKKGRTRLRLGWQARHDAAVQPDHARRHDISREIPKDKDERKACQSGKKKISTNVLITANENRVIIGVSDYALRATHTT